MVGTLYIGVEALGIERLPLVVPLAAAGDGQVDHHIDIFDCLPDLAKIAQIDLEPAGIAGYGGSTQQSQIAVVFQGGNQLAADGAPGAGYENFHKKRVR